jgi:hypothetical protein
MIRKVRGDGNGVLAVGAMLWGFHRLMGTEYERLISWVPSRTALLMTALSIWSLYCLLIGLRSRRWDCLLLAVLLYLLALGAYEQAITLLPLLAGAYLLAAWDIGQDGLGGWWRRLANCCPDSGAAPDANPAGAKPLSAPAAA